MTPADAGGPSSSGATREPRAGATDRGTADTGSPLPSGATLLRLMWLASPALPVGGFSYSEGLEAAVEAGLLTDEAAAAGWLVDQLHLTLARSDLPVLLRAVGAWRSPAPADAVARLNDWVRRTRESSELRRQTEQMGRSLADWLRNGGSGAPADGGVAATALDAEAAPPAGARPATDPRVALLATLAPAPTWPIAFALAAAQTGAASRDAAFAHAFAWAETMVQAAMKTVPLGQAAGQRILGRLAGEIPAAVEAAEALAADGRDDVLQAYAPMLAVLSARHEAQYSRLFRS